MIAAMITNPLAHCERRGASRGAASNGLRGRGTQLRLRPAWPGTGQRPAWPGNAVAAACVAGERKTACVAEGNDERRGLRGRGTQVTACVAGERNGRHSRSLAACRSA